MDLRLSTRRLRARSTGMLWLRENAVMIVTVVIVGWIGYAVVNALRVARRTPPPADAAEDLARAERVKRQVREKIADLKANKVPPPVTRSPSKGGTAKGPSQMPPIDPFGGNRPRSWWARVRRWLGGR